MKELVNPEIKELRRLADDADARSAAKWAGAGVAYAYDFRGISDPAYVANIIEAEIVRHQASPSAPLVERPWSGDDLSTGMTFDEFAHYANAADASSAARSAAIRVVRSYARAIAAAEDEEISTAAGPAVTAIAERIEDYLAIPTSDSAATKLEAINRHRRKLGMQPLDPVGSGWSEEDVGREAERIERLPNLGRLMPR